MYNRQIHQNEPPVHGALDFGELERLGLRPDEIIDFSVNGNPYGPSPRVREALASVQIGRYPDRECLALRRAILEYDLAGHDLSLENVVVGNGTAELIWAVARAFLGPGATTAVIGPTFGEYRAASQAVGANVVEWQAEAKNKFRLSTIPSPTFWLSEQNPALVWLCQPNNPTGYYLTGMLKSDLFYECRKLNAVLVVDEAYWRFLRVQGFSSVEWLADYPNLIILRSLTKDYGLAGLRLGYAVAHPDLAHQIAAQLPSWNVNAFAQAGGVAALVDQAHLNHTLELLRQDRTEFFAALGEAGLKVMPSATHYCLIEVGDAREVRQQLLDRKLLVRDCTSFGLPQFIRVATRPRDDWSRLVSALKELT